MNLFVKGGLDKPLRRQATAAWVLRILCLTCVPPLLAGTTDPAPLAGPNLDVHDPTPVYVRAMLAARAASGSAGTAARLPGADVELGGWSEPTVAVNPANPLNIAYASLGELRVSTDGGTTWLAPVPPVLPPDYAPGGDPSLAFDASGRLFFSYLAFRLGPYQSFLGIDMFIAQIDPTSGAFLPGYPVNVTVQLGIPGSAGNVNDKEWLTADADPDSPFADRLYLVWTRLPPAGDEVTLSSWSSDQGMTWSPPLQLGTAGTGISWLWPAHLAVAPGGSVYVAQHRQPGFSGGAPDGISGVVELFRSTDGGGTFPVQSQPFGPGKADMTFNVQSAAAGAIPGTDFWLQGSVQPWVLADPNVAGRVYVIAADDPDNLIDAGDAADVFIVRSDDSGATWGLPVRVDSGPGTSFQVMPTAQIDPSTGAIAVQYYDNRNGAVNAMGNYLLDVYQTVSVDGGVTFTPDFQVNDMPFDPDAGSFCRLGCGPWINGVHAVGTGAFAVADDGSLLLYDAGSWSIAATAPVRTFGVWAAGLQDVFVCGVGGRIFHYDGSTLASQASGTHSDLLAMSGTSGTDVYAVGALGTVRHYDGTSWSSLSAPTSEELRDVWVSPTGKVFVAGHGGTVLRYDGAWTDLSIGGPADLRGVWGLSDSDVYVTSLDNGLQHWDGTSWTTIDNGWPVVEDVWGSSATDILTVSWGEIRRYDGTAWTQQSGSQEILLKVHGTAANNVFAVGSNAEIIHFDGTGWQWQDHPLRASTPTLRIGEYTGVGTGLGRVDGVWCGNTFDSSDPIDQQSIFDWNGIPGLTPGEAGSTEPLRVSRSNGNLVITWGASDCSGVSYALYRGDLATLAASGYNHDSALACAELTTQVIVPESDPSLGTSDYFLVVAMVGAEEGSYGRNSGDAERPVSGAACQPVQNLGSCGR